MVNLEDISISFQPYPSFFDAVVSCSQGYYSEALYRDHGFTLSGKIVVPNNHNLFSLRPPVKFFLEENHPSTCQHFSVIQSQSLFSITSSRAVVLPNVSPSRITTISPQLTCYPNSEINLIRACRLAGHTIDLDLREIQDSSEPLGPPPGLSMPLSSLHQNLI